MGYGAKQGFAKERRSRWFHWLERYGARTMLLAWLPGIGDPICVLGGWLRLPFWPCVGYMALGKFLRYLIMTWLLLKVPDGFWRQIIGWF
jgi:membrane protein YqaA with SNARE-associated domain